MQSVKDLNLSQIVNLSRLTADRPRGREVRLDAFGLPLDRTVCPRCLGLDSECPACVDGLVCPTCRGGRIMRTENPIHPSYMGCPDCTDWRLQSTHRWEGRWPLYSRDPDWEARTIERALLRGPANGRVDGAPGSRPGAR